MHSARTACMVVVLCLWAAGSFGQDVRSIALEKPRSVKELGAPAGLARNAEAERQRYRRATSRIREHHRPVPLPKTTKAFATAMEQPPAAVVKKGEPISFPKNIKILGQKSIVGAAKLEYDFASPVGEPTVAATPTEVLVTGNWYSALSLDGGKTFSALDPNQLFANDPIGNGFCCDQVAFFDERTDTTFWLLQGTKNTRGNAFRILIAKGSKRLRNQDWFFIDVTSPQVVGSEGFWLDFPSFAASTSHIFISANVFSATGDEAWAGATVIRIPKEPLLKEEQPAATTWMTQTFGSPRLVEGAKETMYWASHGSTGNLAVWSWPDAASQPVGPLNVDIEPWTAESNASSEDHSPLGRPWLKRLDGRITAGWAAQGTIGFAWTAREDNRFKLPHARVAILSDPLPASPGAFGSVKPLAEPHIWSDSFALAYPAVGADAKGRVGVSMSIGGRTMFPTHAIGVLTRNGDSFKWGFAVPTKAVNTPACPKEDGTIDRNCGVWGDYFVVRPHPARDGSWVSVGYSVQSTDKELLRVEPEYMWFNSE